MGNLTLQEQLALRAQLTFKRNAYWRGENGPFCSRCLDTEMKLVRLHQDGPDLTPYCPSCRTQARDPNRPPDPPGRAITGDEGGEYDWMKN